MSGEEMRDHRTVDMTGQRGNLGIAFALRLAELSRRELRLRSALAVPLEGRR